MTELELPVEKPTLMQGTWGVETHAAVAPSPADCNIMPLLATVTSSAAVLAALGAARP